MRAWVLDEGTETYRLGEEPEPTVGPWDVKVELRASALNHLDLWVAKGLPKPPAYPHVPGADGAGVVVDVGQAVEALSPGAEVVIDPSTSCGRCEACLAGDIPYCPSFAVIGEHRWGTHAERVVVPGSNVSRKPEGLSWGHAAAFGLVVSSAVRMARRGKIGADSRVLIVGVGGGSAVAAFLVARSLGAQLFATSRTEAARSWATELGAAVFESTGSYDERVRAATGGRGVDVVIDNVGTDTFERSLRSLAKGGRLVTNGSTTGRTAELSLPALFWRQLEVVGASMNDRSDFAEAARLVAGGDVVIPVGTPVPFEEYPDALEQLRRGDQLGKLVLNR
ncbi:MAG: zinc-binding dehydrogenase [Actinomycetota bacterium]